MNNFLFIKEELKLKIIEKINILIKILIFYLTLKKIFVKKK